MRSIRPSVMRPAALLLAGVTLGGAMVAAGGSGAVAQSQQWTGSSSVEDLRYRLDVLDAELADLRARLGGGPGAPATGGGGAAAALSNSAVTELEGEVRRLTAAVEELRYRQGRIADEAARRFSDIEFRLTELEGGDVSNLQPVPPLGGIGEAQAPAPQPEPAPAPAASGGTEPAVTGATAFGTGVASAPTPTPTPPARPGAGTGGTGQAGGIVAGPAGQGSFPGVEVPYAAPGEQVAAVPAPGQDELEVAVRDVRQGRFDEAEERLRDFLDRNPDGPMAADAWYWLGESQFARGSHAEAARSYLHGFRADESGPQAARNLYRLGVALGRLGQVNEACLTLRQVRSQFPGAPDGLVEKADAEADSLACG